MKNPVTMLKDLAGRLAGARSALADLHTTDKALRTMREALQAERGHLLSARPPKADVIAEAERQVDASAAAWVDANGQRLVDAVAGRVEMSASGEVRLVGGNLFDTPGFEGALDVRTLAALAPDLLKAGLRRTIEATPFLEGPPLRERPRLIAEVNAKIADVEAQHSHLVDQAAELGIVLELLDDVRARRAHAAHVAEFQEQQARDLARKVRR